MFLSTSPSTLHVCHLKNMIREHHYCTKMQQTSCLQIECSSLCHKPSPKGFQRIWQYIHPASEPQTTCNCIPRPSHPVVSPPRPSETSHPYSCCNNRFTYPQNFWTIYQKPPQGSYYACWCWLDALSNDTSNLMASGTMQVFSIYGGIPVFTLLGS